MCDFITTAELNMVPVSFACRLRTWTQVDSISPRKMQPQKPLAAAGQRSALQAQQTHNLSTAFASHCQ
jgi:hypothetical protein